MKQISKRLLAIAAALLAAFVLWTCACSLIDVQAIGPEGSSVGFAAINGAFHDFTGLHMCLYTLTDYLSLIPLAFVAGFAILGLAQWIRRKSLSRVDRSILVLGAFYIAVFAVYALFEACVVNYRPVLIGGVLEASYPSSTTMLVLCVMPSAVLQFKARIKKRALCRVINTAILLFALFMLAGRLISGVHWLSDIVGGILLSAGLVALYTAFAQE